MAGELRTLRVSLTVGPASTAVRRLEFPELVGLAIELRQFRYNVNINDNGVFTVQISHDLEATVIGPNTWWVDTGDYLAAAQGQRVPPQDWEPPKMVGGPQLLIGSWTGSSTLALEGVFGFTLRRVGVVRWTELLRETVVAR